jgi:8-oxo-dGTP pyrophosphatase MutT (NUDIX family)
MTRTLDKVTAFITRQHSGAHQYSGARQTASSRQILLVRHPYAGIQFPAGTVEEGEAFEAAILREVQEETRLQHAVITAQLGELIEQYPRRAFALCPVTVYARPDTTSFDWARLPRGVGVDVLREQDGFVHVSFVEGDVYPNPAYTTYQITGWVREDCLATQMRRRIYHLTTEEDTSESWQVLIDQHNYTLFWVDVNAMPEIVQGQRQYCQRFGRLIK